jgi:hypothetical protein
VLNGTSAEPLRLAESQVENTFQRLGSQLRAQRNTYAIFGRPLLAAAMFLFVTTGNSPIAFAETESGVLQTFRAADFMQSVKNSVAPEPVAAEHVTLAKPHCQRPQLAEAVIHGSNISPAFVEELEKMVALLPAGSLHALSKAGYKIELSHLVTDAVPAARDQQVRGYEPHSTWDSVFGMFNRTERKVVMAEYAKDNGKYITLQDEQRRAGILRHEFGHAIDNFLGNFSHSEEFQQAYAKGKASISKEEEVVIWYYLQAGDAGPEETFAEIFASLKGTACDRASDQILHDHFPELVSLINDKVAQIK